ncbi:MAG TPA: tetratricopeptide repeat protein [Candidatus Xenobia bacterium]|nr:tetratricopeptide repeat protein [Candidatus Xenobia bacterium]
MADIDKILEKAEKYLSKGKYEAAIGEYKSALEISPNNIELLRTIGDLYVRAGSPGDATRYYGDLFDKLAERNDATKAVLLFRKSLQQTPQPPERHARLGALLQRQGKTGEAVEAYRTALDLFRKAGNANGILEALERLTTLEPDNADAQIALGEQAQRMNKTDEATRAFLRAGQLLRAGELPRALELLERAHELAPDRTTALALAQARVDNNQANDAAELLLPYYADDTQDLALLESLGAALLAANRLGESVKVLETFYKLKPDTYEKLFELAGLYCGAGQAEQAVEVLARVKENLFAAKRQNDFVERLDQVFKAHSMLAPLAEFAASTYNELNKEGRYFNVLTSLFKIYFQASDFKRAVDTLERLIDIDPYDYHNQEYLAQLKGKIDDTRYRAVASRIASAASVGGQAAGLAPAEEKADATAAIVDPARRRALLEDMMVQVELFLQYSLTGKAIEKLQKVWELFPGEESNNQRLYDLYARAQYFPQGFGQPPSAEAGAAAPAAPARAPAAAPPAPVAVPVETSNDLAKIAEITHTLFRQTTPKTVLNTAISELGKYLRASRCLGVLGRPGGTPSTAVEWCAPGVPQSPGTAVLKLLGLLGQSNLDPESGAVLSAQLSPELKQVGAQSVLAMPLIDKEKQEQLGLIVVSQADQNRTWKPNEVYLVRAVATQVESAVTHIQLRSLMKKYAVGDEASGVLGRGSYLDTLVSEAKRSRTVGTPMVLVLFELDKGAQLLRQVGEAPMQELMQKAGETILANVRQSDMAFRYTQTSVAVLLGDTTAQKAKPVVEKLRKALASLKLAGAKDPLTFSAGMSEAAVRPDYDALDIVTDVINRAEFSLDEARKKVDAVVVL